MRKINGRLPGATAALAALGLVESAASPIIASVFTHTDRNNQYTRGWSTQFYNHAAGTDGATFRAFLNILQGDMYPASTSGMPIGDDADGDVRLVEFAHAQRTGHSRDKLRYQNDTSYSGTGIRVMPIRNSTSSAITATVYFGYSNYWSSGYEGAAVAVFTPNAANYAGATGGTVTSAFSVTSPGSGQVDNQGSATVTIPANTTVLVMLVSSDIYFTTYRFWDTNYFNRLNDTFAAGLSCDLRMLATLAYARVPQANGGPTNDTHLIYNACAQLYGDR